MPSHLQDCASCDETRCYVAVEKATPEYLVGGNVSSNVRLPISTPADRVQQDSHSYDECSDVQALAMTMKERNVLGTE